MSHTSKTKVVGYSFGGPFDDAALERVLARAQEAGVVTEYDTGRGHFCWFNGPPGKPLRRVRAEVAAVVERGVKP